VARTVWWCSGRDMVVVVVFDGGGE